MNWKILGVDDKLPELDGPIQLQLEHVNGTLREVALACNYDVVLKIIPGPYGGLQLLVPPDPKPIYEMRGELCGFRARPIEFDDEAKAREKYLWHVSQVGPSPHKIQLVKVTRVGDEKEREEVLAEDIVSVAEAHADPDNF